jgi:GMP synthase (glutamine-hydrolysing)
MLFKDEVRNAGRELGIPENLVSRQPFPGPGLAIRIIGEVTEEKVKIVQEADAIYREEIAAYSEKQYEELKREAGHDSYDPMLFKKTLQGSMGQYFAALTNMRSVGVMGDFRTYDYAIALRAVMTADFMTAEAAQIPWPLLSKITTRIVNEVDHVNRVMFDCTSKPPGTIEFE